MTITYKWIAGLIVLLALGGVFYRYSASLPTSMLTPTATTSGEALRSGESVLPKLTPHEGMHFTISLPEGWTVQTMSENRDQVIFSDPKEPTTFVAVFTIKVSNEAGKWPKLEERWQFVGRNLVPFKNDNGLEGISAEGPRQTDPTKQILAVGYRINDSWEMIVEAGASKGKFASMKPLFTAIQKTLKPDPQTL